MNIELVNNEMPFGHSWLSFNGASNMVQIVLFGAGGTDRGGANLAGGHIKIDDKGQGAVANIFVLPPLYLTRSQRQAGMLPFQSLDPAQLIVTDDPLPLLSQCLRLVIETIDVAVFFVKLLISFGGQPIADQVGFDVGLFLKDVRRGGPKSA